MQHVNDSRRCGYFLYPELVAACCLAINCDSPSDPSDFVPLLYVLRLYPAYPVHPCFPVSMLDGLSLPTTTYMDGQDNQDEIKIPKFGNCIFQSRGLVECLGTGDR